MNHYIKTINLGIDKDFIINKLNSRASKTQSELLEYNNKLKRDSESMKATSKMYLIVAAVNIVMAILMVDIVYALFSIYFIWRYYQCKFKAYDMALNAGLNSINSAVISTCENIYQSMELDELFEIDNIGKIIPEVPTIRQLWESDIESIELSGNELSYTIDGLTYTVSPVTVRDGELNCITLLSGGIFIGDQKNVKVQTKKKEVSIPVKIKECDCE